MSWMSYSIGHVSWGLLLEDSQHLHDLPSKSHAHLPRWVGAGECRCDIFKTYKNGRRGNRWLNVPYAIIVLPSFICDKFPNFRFMSFRQTSSFTIRSRLNRSSASLRYKIPMSTPSEFVMITLPTFLLSMRLTSVFKKTSGRKVDGPFSITSSIGVCGSAFQASPRSRPNTTFNSFTTTHTFHPNAWQRSYTSPSRSVNLHVGTSCRTISPALGISANLPAIGRPNANQSSLPAA